MYRLFRARRWVASGIMLSILMMNVMSYGGPLLHTAEASTKEDYAALAKKHDDCIKKKNREKSKIDCAKTSGIADFKKENPQLNSLWTRSPNPTRPGNNIQNLKTNSNPKTITNVRFNSNIPSNNTPKFNDINFSKINPTSIGSSGDAKLFQTDWFAQNGIKVTSSDTPPENTFSKSNTIPVNSYNLYDGKYNFSNAFLPASTPPPDSNKDLNTQKLNGDRLFVNVGAGGGLFSPGENISTCLENKKIYFNNVESKEFDCTEHFRKSSVPETKLLTENRKTCLRLKLENCENISQKDPERVAKFLKITENGQKASSLSNVTNISPTASTSLHFSTMKDCLQYKEKTFKDHKSSKFDCTKYFKDKEGYVSNELSTKFTSVSSSVPTEDPSGIIANSSNDSAQRIIGKDKAINCYREILDNIGTKKSKNIILTYYDNYVNSNLSNCNGVSNSDIILVVETCLNSNNDNVRNSCKDPTFVNITLSSEYENKTNCDKEGYHYYFEGTGTCYKEIAKARSSAVCPKGNYLYYSRSNETTIGTQYKPHDPNSESTDLKVKILNCDDLSKINKVFCETQKLSTSALSQIKSKGEITGENICVDKGKTPLQNIGEWALPIFATAGATYLALKADCLFSPKQSKCSGKQEEIEQLNNKASALTAQISIIENQNRLQALQNPPTQPTPPSDNASTPSPTPPKEEEPETPFIPPIPSDKPVTTNSPTAPAKPSTTAPAKPSPSSPTEGENTEEDTRSLPSADPSVNQSSDGAVEDTIMVLLELIDQRKVTALRNSIAGATRARSVVKGQEINGINVGKLAESYGGDGGPAPVLGKEYDVNGDGTVNKEDYSALEKITRICNKNVTKSPCQVFFKL